MLHEALFVRFGDRVELILLPEESKEILEI